MRSVTVKIAEKELLLHYSVDVMFDVNEEFGSLDAALDLLREPGRKGFETLLWFTRRLAREGELLRRGRGEAAGGMPPETELSLRMQPLEAMELSAAVSDAIAMGYRREVPGRDEVDLGLAELRKNGEAGA